MTDQEPKKITAKEGLNTADALANNFIEEMDAISTEDDVADNQELILESQSQMFAQLFRLQFDLTDRTRLEDFETFTKNYLGNHLMLSNDLFNAAKSKARPRVLTEVRRIAKPLLEAYAKEKNETAFNGLSVSAVIDDINRRAADATHTDVAPKTQAWGDDFKSKLRSPEAQRVQGGSASGNSR